MGDENEMNKVENQETVEVSEPKKSFIKRHKKLIIFLSILLLAAVGVFFFIPVQGITYFDRMQVERAGYESRKPSRVDHIDLTRMDALGVDTSGYYISVIEDDEIIKEFSYNDIVKMNKSTDQSGDFVGVDFKEFLEMVDPQILEKYDRYLITAGDSFTATIKAEDLESEHNVTLVYERKGQRLTHFGKFKGNGPLRLIVSEDDRGERSIKFIIAIELLNSNDDSK